MARLLLVFGLSLGLTACATTQGAGTTAPPPSQAAADYYPLAPGWGWAYDLERDGQTVLAVYSVTKNDGKTATLLNAGATIAYQLQADGIARQEGGIMGDYLLKNPIVPGARWPVFAGEAQITQVGATVTLGTERYLNCVVVEERRKDPTRTTRTTYAQGVGPIEIEMQVQDPLTHALATSVHARLRGVTKPEAGAE
jgi:hypothetical protein